MAVGAIVLGGLRAFDGLDSQAIAIWLNDRTDLRVEKDRMPGASDPGAAAGGFDEVVKLTNVGRSTITIRNVLINDREHCAQLGPFSQFEPPLTLLDMGGWATLRVVCPGAIARVTVETNRGKTTYSWKVATGMAEK